MNHVTVRRKCKKCEKGEVRQTDGPIYGNGLGTHYEHECILCGEKEVIANQSYPYSYNEYDQTEMREEWE